jgi:hypothetical protein
MQPTRKKKRKGKTEKKSKLSQENCLPHCQRIKISIEQDINPPNLSPSSRLSRGTRPIMSITKKMIKWIGGQRAILLANAPGMDHTSWTHPMMGTSNSHSYWPLLVDQKGLEEGK